MIDDGDCEAVGGMKIGRGNRSRKPAPAPLCPPQIPHEQTWARTRAAAALSQRLTIWAMARPMSGGIAPRILNIGTAWRRRVSFTSCSLTSRETVLGSHWRLNGSECRSGRCGEEINFLPLSGIEHRFLCVVREAWPRNNGITNTLCSKSGTGICVNYIVATLSGGGVLECAVLLWARRVWEPLVEPVVSSI
jgi:hypothetical protein